MSKNLRYMGVQRFLSNLFTYQDQHDLINDVYSFEQLPYCALLNKVRSILGIRSSNIVQNAFAASAFTVYIIYPVITSQFPCDGSEIDDFRILQTPWPLLLLSSHSYQCTVLVHLQFDGNICRCSPTSVLDVSSEVSWEVCSSASRIVISALELGCKRVKRFIVVNRWPLWNGT